MILKVLIIFLVLANAEEKCKKDSDCLELNSCINDVCQHKDLFPLGTTEYIGLVVMIIVSTIANAGGVGGSSMTISLMLLLHKFDAHQCVALTQVFIFAGTTTATALKLRDRHPTRDRPLIYYDVLMQIVSPILVGVSIGVMANPAFPAWLILSLLTLVVIVLVWDVLNRSIKLYRKETLANKVNPQAQSDNKCNLEGQKDLFSNNLASPDYEKNIENNPNARVSEGDNMDSPSFREENKEAFDESEESSKPEMRNEKKEKEEKDEKAQDHGPQYSESEINLEKSYSLPSINYNPGSSQGDTIIAESLLRKITTIYQEERKIISWVPLLYFIILAGTSIIFAMIKGSSSSKSIVNIIPCSDEFFALNFGYFGFMFMMNALASYYLVNKTRVCEQTNYIFDEGDIKWNYKKCLIVTLVSIGAGIVVGLLGMGGGNLIGPMLLALGVRPEISTISSSFTIFISSGTAAAQFFIAGIIDFSYAAWFFGLSTLGSLCGILILRRYAIKKQRVSLLIFCLSIILTCSLVIIPTIGIMTAVKQSNEGTFQLGFKNIC